MAQTYNDIYINIRNRLRAAGVEACALEARLFLEQATGFDGARLLKDMHLYAGEGVAERAWAAAERRVRGEPAAYITGLWEFYGLPMLVTRDVLIPRPDTEVLVETALGLPGVRRRPLRILDLCCGSGCIGCAMGHSLPDARLLLADLSPAALELCRKNVIMNGLAQRAVCMRADALSPAPAGVEDYDLLLCNPPYITEAELLTLDPSVRDWEPRMALCGGGDGLVFYRAVLAGWTGAVAAGGWLLFEVGEGQARPVGEMLERAGFADTRFALDPAGTQRVVYGRKGG